jgi:anthranilate synthase component 1
MNAVPDPFKVFLHVRKAFPQAFFFQSAETTGHLPLVTVIGLEAEEVFTVAAATRSRNENGDVENSLSRLQVLLKTYSLKRHENFPYESGGAFGVVGYDMVREIEPRLKKSGYFAKLENTDGHSVEAEIHFVKNLIVFDHKNNSVHVVLKSNSGNNEKKRTVINSVLAQIDRSGVAEFPSHSHSTGGYDGLSLEPSLGEGRFKEAVLKLKRHIADGDIFQAVLAERFECRISSNSIDIFHNLRRLSPAAYSFYFRFSQSDFFGASPETLVRSQQGMIETHPIAGTRPRGATEADDQRLENQLVRSIKEGAEHLMLVDLARNDLGKVSQPGSVKVTSYREVMRLSNVMHLLSKVEGQLASHFSDFDALSACFPAGTLSGAPKIRAMEIVSQLETVPRGFYGGAAVAFDFCGGLDSCIAIRAVEVQGDRAILRAGAGIVADSDPASEYQEILHKLATVRKALASAEAQFEAAV